MNVIDAIIFAGHEIRFAAGLTRRVSFKLEFSIDKNGDESVQYHATVGDFSSLHESIWSCGSSVAECKSNLIKKIQDKATEKALRLAQLKVDAEKLGYHLVPVDQ